MAIYRLFREGSFDQGDINSLSAAYERALKLLQLKDRQDPLTELLAAKIIQVWRVGETDPEKICARTIEELCIQVPK